MEQLGRTILSTPPYFCLDGKKSFQYTGYSDQPVNFDPLLKILSNNRWGEDELQQAWRVSHLLTTVRDRDSRAFDKLTASSEGSSSMGAVSKALVREGIRLINLTDQRDTTLEQFSRHLVEVRNSANEDTIRCGTKETLEYLVFSRLNEANVLDRDDEEYFGPGWNGLPVVQNLQKETATFEEQFDSKIKVLQAARPENQPKNIVE